MVKWVEKSANKGVTQEDFTSTTESTQVLAETELFDEKQQLFDLMFQKLGDKWEVLQLSFLYNLWKKWPKLNVTYGYVRKKKLCTGQFSVDSRNQSL
jgi:hypothetical protein